MSPEVPKHDRTALVKRRNNLVGVLESRQARTAWLQPMADAQPTDGMTPLDSAVTRTRSAWAKSILKDSKSPAQIQAEIGALDAQITPEGTKPKPHLVINRDSGTVLVQFGDQEALVKLNPVKRVLLGALDTTVDQGVDELSMMPDLDDLKPVTALVTENPIATTTEAEAPIERGFNIPHIAMDPDTGIGSITYQGEKRPIKLSNPVSRALLKALHAEPEVEAGHSVATLDKVLRTAIADNPGYGTKKSSVGLFMSHIGRMLEKGFPSEMKIFENTRPATRTRQEKSYSDRYKLVASLEYTTKPSALELPEPLPKAKEDIGPTAFKVDTSGNTLVVVLEDKEFKFRGRGIRTIFEYLLKHPNHPIKIATLKAIFPGTDASCAATIGNLRKVLEEGRKPGSILKSHHRHGGRGIGTQTFYELCAKVSFADTYTPLLKYERQNDKPHIPSNSTRIEMSYNMSPAILTPPPEPVRFVESPASIVERSKKPEVIITQIEKVEEGAVKEAKPWTDIEKTQVKAFLDILDERGDVVTFLELATMFWPDRRESSLQEEEIIAILKIASKARFDEHVTNTNRRISLDLSRENYGYYFGEPEATSSIAVEKIAPKEDEQRIPALRIETYEGIAGYLNIILSRLGERHEALIDDIIWAEIFQQLSRNNNLGIAEEDLDTTLNQLNPKHRQPMDYYIRKIKNRVEGDMLDSLIHEELVGDKKFYRLHAQYITRVVLKAADFEVDE